jgi:hypothetical protein
MKLPPNLDKLITLAADAADGARQLEAILGLKQNTEPGLRADLAGLLAAKSAYETADAALSAAYTVQTLARSNARGFLAGARDVFKKVFGSQPSTAWEAAGWPNDSIAIPSTSERILPRLKSVELYLQKNPARENAPMDVTQAQAAALHQALTDARNAVNQQETLVSDCLLARQAAEEKLRARLRGLVAELDQLLGPLDPRWLTFGFKMPGAPEAPEAVANLRATPLGGGQVRVQGERAPRADYYQVWMKVAGVDGDWRRADSPAAPDTILAGLPLGAKVSVEMRALNETGPGPFGPAVEVVVS